jgi:fructuronate reductase
VGHLPQCLSALLVIAPRPPSSPSELARLSIATLPRVPATARPRIDPRGLGVGIVHLGPGAFHRAHQAVFCEDAIAAAGGEWGICGVTQTSPVVLDRLIPQDGLYSVVAGDGEGVAMRVVGTLRELLWARGEPERVLERIAAPSTRVLTVTVTEKGYRRDPSCGCLDLADPDVAADLADGGIRTVPAQIARGLQRRHAAGVGLLSVVSCDNLSGNGPILRELVLDFAARCAADDLAQWIEAEIAFPSTMVDRMVPAVTAAHRAASEERLGLSDAGALVTEPFSQWVIEDRFPGGRPAWERAGATLASDVAPYERVKLRMLNASHSALAYLGALAGCDLIADTLRAERPFAAATQALMREDAAPTLKAPPGIDLDHYGRQVLQRFVNPELPYRTLQVASDGSQKLPQRVLGLVRDRRAAGAEPRWAALAVAAWMRFVSARHADDGRELPLSDPLSDQIEAALHNVSQPTQIVDRLLAIEAIFGRDLAADAVWRELLIEHLRRLAADGAQRAVSDLVS